LAGVKQKILITWVGWAGLGYNSHPWVGL